MKTILASFKLGDFLQNCQFAKLKTLPKFPTIQYARNVIVIALGQVFMAVNQPESEGYEATRAVYVAINPWQPVL